MPRSRGCKRWGVGVSAVGLGCNCVGEQVKLCLTQGFYLHDFAAAIGPAFVEVGHQASGVGAVDPPGILPISIDLL